MSKIAFKSEMTFEPAAIVAIDAAAASGIYATPESMAPTLGSMSYLTYKPAIFSYHIKLNQATAGGSGKVKLMAGDDVITSANVDFSAAQEINGNAGVDLSAVTGTQLLKVVVDLGASADAGTVATVNAKLWIEQPLVISGCS